MSYLATLKGLWAGFMARPPGVPTHQPERGDGESREDYAARRRDSKRAAQASMLRGPFNPNPRRPF
jgi:hypothetical protein